MKPIEQTEEIKKKVYISGAISGLPIESVKKKLRRARIVNRIFQIFRLQGTGNVTEISHKIRLEKQKMQELDKRMACIQELLTTFKTK